MLYNEVLVLGDSHAKVFECDELRSAFPNHFFNVVTVAGATVSGLKNPNSKTQAMPIFMDHARKTKSKYAITLLGEVDTGFVIWYRAEKYNKPVDVMLDEAVDNYRNLLEVLQSKVYVICMSAPLPTIQDNQDNQDHGDVANARQVIFTSQVERTKLTLRFNDKVRDACKEVGCTFISFDQASIGKKGVVRSTLLNKNESDHHYDHSEYAKIIIRKLQPWF